MKRLFEKWYVLFMLLRIAHHNKVRMKFERKYDDVFTITVRISNI